MCEQCKEIEARIDRYKRISASVTDPFTLDQIKKLINELVAQKAMLHPNE